jgi:hypothetical protein
MNREEAKALLPVIQAYADGKEVEWRNPKDKLWEPAEGLHIGGQYRIKPEKRERWLVIFSNGGSEIINELPNIGLKEYYHDAIACIRIEYTAGEGLD